MGLNHLVRDFNFLTRGSQQAAIFRLLGHLERLGNYITMQMCGVATGSLWNHFDPKERHLLAG